MNLFGKPLKEVTLADVELLVSQKVKESKILDYKLLLKLDDDKSQINMLKDFVAFANAQGGCLIYGVKEVDSIPTAVVGYRVKDYDLLIQKIQNLANTKIEPPIYTLHFRKIPYAGNKSILIIHIPKSWSALHRVNYQTSTFYMRQAGKNQSMDVYQIRQAMLLNQTYEKKIHDFIKERKKIIAHEQVPVTMGQGPKLLFHIVPIEPFLNHASFDVLRYFDNPQACAPISSSPIEKFLNLDGLVVTHGDATHIYSYVQLFRCGVIEACDARVFNSETKTIAFELGNKLTNALSNYFQILQSYKINSAIYISISLLNAKGYRMKLPESNEATRAIDRDPVVLETFVHTGVNTQANEALKPLFGLLFNVLGVGKNLF
jgi:hypothetical protein